MNKRREFHFGIALFIFIAFMAIFGPRMNEFSYHEINLPMKNSPPSWGYWFGTDDLGRDLFTRVWIGARLSLFVGLSAALIDTLVGVLWGCIAGLSGRRVDGVMMRIADILFALPYLLIVILTLVAMGPGLSSILFAMTILGWITMARVVRGQVLQIKEADYVLASKALGASFSHILRVHILPNTKDVILATLALTVPQAIFTEAFLSFLGLGIQAPLSSWGTMTTEALPALAYYPWRLFFPAFFMSLTMLAFYLIGEGLTDE